MKILFLVSGNAKSNFSHRAVTLARELHKLGHESTIIAPRADKYNDFISEAIETIDGVKIIQPFQFATKRIEVNLFPYLFSAARTVLREKPDLVYIYKPTPITIIGLIAKFFRGTPVVLDMDDLGSEVMKIEGHPWHQRTLVAWCERIAARRADRMVTASTYLFELYKNKFPGKPIHLMPNGVESDWFAPLILSKTKERIVFMGAINRQNILEPLFHALPGIYAYHPDVELIIIGDGSYLSHFKEISKEFGIEKIVHFTGWLPLAEARDHLLAGDIGYSYMPDDPTVRAASNMKVPQYMARGVVPIVSDVGDLPAAIDSGRAGYIAKAGHIDALEEALITALTDGNRLQKSEHARAFSETHLQWDALALAFEQWNAKYIVSE